MLDELARWKTALYQRNSQLQETIQQLLDERMTVREEMLKTFRYHINYYYYQTLGR